MTDPAPAPAQASPAPQAAPANTAAPAPVANPNTAQPNAITPPAAAPAPAQAPATEPPKPAEPPKAEAPQPIKLELPKDSPLTADDLKALTDLATKAGLKQDAAAELLASQAKLLTDYQARQEAAHQAQVEAWDKSLADDKEIGGANLRANLDAGRRALEKFGPELIPFLRESGFNSNPDVVKFIVRIGKAMAEDRIATGQTGTGGTRPITAEEFYSTTYSKG
jgi:hypothetical protein